MITSYLEKLIHQGKAEYKTFVAGGSSKCILDVEKNTYIIITNLQYQPNMVGLQKDDFQTWLNNSLIQCNIFSKRKFNHYIWRAEFNNMFELGGVTNFASPGGAFNTPTYLIHEDSVSFSFLLCQNLTFNIVGKTIPGEPALKPPLDYGSASDPTSFSTIRTNSPVGSPASESIPGGKSQPRTTPNAFEGLQFPIDAVSSPNPRDIIDTTSMFVVNVEYVKIYGRIPKQLK